MIRARAGLVRERAAPQHQARALGLAELAAIRATACQPRRGRQTGRAESGERARRRGLADIALCSALFFAGLRRAEAAARAWGDVEALEAIRPEEAGPEDPVFGLSGRQMARRVEAAAAAAGLGGGFSGHSGRTGLAAELSRAGASTHEIAAAGGWKSAGMVIRYTRRETAKRGAVAKYLEEQRDPPG